MIGVCFRSDRESLGLDFINEPLVTVLNTFVSSDIVIISVFPVVIIGAEQIESLVCS